MGIHWSPAEFIRYLPVELLGINSIVRYGPIVEKSGLAKKNQQAECVFQEMYMLTALDGFSAAMDFATLLSDNGRVSVGEALAMPSSCV